MLDTACSTGSECTAALAAVAKSWYGAKRCYPKQSATWGSARQNKRPRTCPLCELCACGAGCLSLWSRPLTALTTLATLANTWNKTHIINGRFLPSARHTPAAHTRGYQTPRLAYVHRLWPRWRAKHRLVFCPRPASHQILIHQRYPVPGSTHRSNSLIHSDVRPVSHGPRHNRSPAVRYAKLTRQKRAYRTCSMAPRLGRYLRAR